MLSAMSWYVVRVGRQTGVFSSWEACHAQVDGFSGACYKKNTEQEKKPLQRSTAHKMEQRLQMLQQMLQLLHRTLTGRHLHVKMP